MSQFNIRKAKQADAEDIANIYNHEITNGNATFDTEIKSIENRQEWLKQHNDKYPVLVVELNNEVIGFASMTRWSERAAYDDTAEISIYLSPSVQSKGIGKQLMVAIVEAGKQGGLHCVLSRITQGNDKSIYLHQQLGFETVGVLKQVGKKFNQLLDVTMMQLIYV